MKNMYDSYIRPILALNNLLQIEQVSSEDDISNRLQQVECNVFPTVTETTKAIQQLSLGKAQGSESTNGKETFRVISLHVEKGGNPTRFHGCIHNPPIQNKRKFSSVTTI